MYICYIKYLEKDEPFVLAVGDNEIIVGNDELDMGDSEVASFGWEAYKATWTRDPMNWLRFSGFSGDTGTKTFDNQFLFVIFVFYSLIRFE